MIHNLDENLSSTWFAYADYLKDCIIEKKFKEGTEFSEKVKHPELTFTSSSYALYWALLYAYNNDLVFGGQEAIMPGSDKAKRQYMMGKPSEECYATDGHCLFLTILVVFVSEGDGLVIDLEQTVIGDGYLMGVPA